MVTAARTAVARRVPSATFTYEMKTVSDTNVNFGAGRP